MSKQEQPSVITQETRISLFWLFATCTSLCAIILFVSDIRSVAEINKVKNNQLENNLQTLQFDIKAELRILQQKLDKILLSSKCLENRNTDL